SQEALLNTDEGQQRIDDLVDSQGQKLRYKQLTRNVYRITSAGSDKDHQTQWDVVLMGRISREEKTDSQQKEARLTWLENRIIELKGEAGKQEVERARGDIPETEITHNITVGGQDTLEGADYFAFWTKVVLITAVLFIPVGYFYKEKSYIQESDTTEPVGEDSH
ncbi:MAG: hypothetical protein KDA87_22250, partial [Planctomycetales bacterium]|nr:hypothetical protein [Planctomycetales bacterium]